MTNHSTSLKRVYRRISLFLAGGWLVIAGLAGETHAQEGGEGTEEYDRYNMEGVDKWNRMAALYARQRSGAKSGWQRGQEIYYMRCWICHSELVTVGDDFPAPSLRNLFDNRDEVFVRAWIRAGSQGMPSYLPQTLSDKDLDDLITYLREKCDTFETGSGCFDEHNPPPNPLYRYQD
jgi:hypothetical protein